MVKVMEIRTVAIIIGDGRSAHQIAIRAVAVATARNAIGGQSRWAKGRLARNRIDSSSTFDVRRSYLR